jgi:hypothetical protein
MRLETETMWETPETRLLHVTRRVGMSVQRWEMVRPRPIHVMRPTGKTARWTCEMRPFCSTRASQMER